MDEYYSGDVHDDGISNADMYKKRQPQGSFRHSDKYVRSQLGGVDDHCGGDMHNDWHSKTDMFKER